MSMNDVETMRALLEGKILTELRAEDGCYQGQIKLIDGNICMAGTGYRSHFNTLRFEYCIFNDKPKLYTFIEAFKLCKEGQKIAAKNEVGYYMPITIREHLKGTKAFSIESTASLNECKWYIIND
jgi:hypothetical protein